MDQAFEYQIAGGKFLTEPGFGKLLADEMGLGKTRQAILGLGSVLAKKVLIICPSVARINWLREIELWSEQKNHIEIMTSLTDKPQSPGVVICSFDYSTRNFRELNQITWDVLIVDEAHFLKSHDALRSKAVLGSSGLVRSTKKCWLLTGTPAPNHAGELWIMLYVFGVTKMTYDAFIREFCILRPTTYGLKIVANRPEKFPELRSMLAKIMLRRLKKDVMKELPPISFHHVNVEPGLVDFEILPSFTQFFMPTDRRKELTAEINRQQKLLEDVFTNMSQGNDNKINAIESIAQSVSTLRRYVGLQKVDPAVELIRGELESKAYDKIVIFAIHRDVIENMRLGLRDFGAVVIYGGTDPEKRQKNIDRFQNNPKCRVFIGNIHAAGTAITLTKAHHVVFVEQDWVPGNNAQAIMRVHRIGQEQPVSVRFVLLDGTIDTKIGYILKRKTEQLTQIFD